VEVSALKDDTFFGNIIADVNGRTLNVDARPSDALNLAVRAHVPILVARSVMDAAGITPEEDIQGEKQIEAKAPAEPEEPVTEESEERLSIFEDFLEKLDMDKEDGEEEGGEGEEDDKE
jgi:hypothetical protein